MTTPETIEAMRRLWNDRLNQEEAAKTFWKHTAFVLMLALAWTVAALHGWL